jgi:CheY-like chemotaxis protein
VKPRIVIAEDSEALLNLIASFVASLGYTPIPVATGEAALAAVLAAPPVLVISDAGLPGMSGLEVCRRLKSEPATQAIPFVLLTASAPDLRAAAAEAGVDRLFDKPFEREALGSTVAELLKACSE